MTNEEYHADTSRISKSGLDLIRKAPAKYYDRYLNPDAKPRKSTKTFDIGNATHSFTLQRDIFQEQFAVSPIFKGEGSQFRRETFMYSNNDKTVITTDTYDQINGMREAIYNHPIAAKLLSVGEAERVFTWIDEETGAKCKCRPDWWNPERRYIIDIKSADDASQVGFARSAFKYRYHVQDPYYFDGLIANQMQPERFVFIAVEKEPPYLVNVFYYPQSEKEHGREIYQEDLRTYQECLRTGEWSGYGNEIKSLDIPGVF